MYSEFRVRHKKKILGSLNLFYVKKYFYEECNILEDQKLENKKFKERGDMLGNFNYKLDKNICVISLVIISLITLSIISSDLFSLFNISGVFKQ